jgi:hypothetical protein
MSAPLDAPHTLHSLAVCIVTGAVVLAAGPSEARAQEEGEETRENAILGFDVSTTSTTTTTAVVLTFGGVVTTYSFVGGDQSSARRERRRSWRRAMLAHLLTHERQSVEAVLALGAGRTLGDLGALFCVHDDDLGALGATLRRRRGALHRLLDGASDDRAVSAEIAEDILTLVERAMADHPRLVDDLRRLRAWERGTTS